MACEMCSAPDSRFRVEIEGSRLNVCEKCSRFGKLLGRNAPVLKPDSKKEPAMQVKKLNESVQLIRPDFAGVIKQAREKLSLTQEDFAKKLMEKESVLHKIESGHMKPDLTLARKLEKHLKISLVEQVEVEVPSADKDEKKKKGDGFTIGDLITIK